VNQSRGVERRAAIQANALVNQAKAPRLIRESGPVCVRGSPLCALLVRSLSVKLGGLAEEIRMRRSSVWAWSSWLHRPSRAVSLRDKRCTFKRKPLPDLH